MVAARERRRTEAARAAARARARSSWSSLEPSGNAGGGDCSSTREPTAVPRAGGGVRDGAGAGASSAGGIVGRSTAAAERSGAGVGWVNFWGVARASSLPVVISNFWGGRVARVGLDRSGNGRISEASWAGLTLSLVGSSNGMARPKTANRRRPLLGDMCLFLFFLFS